MLSMGSIAANAQEQNNWKDNFFNHLDFGVTAGTTGIGFDVAMPVGNYVKLRTGFSVVPRIEVPMTFGIQVGEDASTSQEKFDRLSGYLHNFTGNDVKQEVEMIGRPKVWNWNVLVDVYPLKNNRHWHVTAGFFLGPSKVAEAYNKTESMASLMAVSMFNNLYERVIKSPVLTDPDYFLSNSALDVIQDIQLLRDLGLVNSKEFPVELSKIWLDPDRNVIKTAYQNLAAYGRMGVQLGKYSHDIVDEEGNVVHKKGDPYLLEPDEDSMVKADMKVNSFKPYIGVGYEGRLLKNNDRLNIGFDAGVMLWGGTPHLTAHDGTDLIHDVYDIPGKVGDYVNAIEKFKVYPVANLRIAYKLF